MRKGRQVQRRVEVTVVAASVVVLTGVQGISPALPGLQDSLGLDDAGVSLIMLVYVVAAAVASFPSGVLANRFGTRAVLAWALTLFGTGGVMLALEGSFPVLLVVRTVQGAAFGAVLALTIAALADASGRAELARTQSRRVVAMSLGESVLPVVAGVLIVLAGEFSVFWLQALALPAAVACAAALPARGAVPRASGASAGSALKALRTPFAGAVQAPGFVRFFLKFAVLTYFPLFAGRDHGMSAAAVGLVVGAAGLLATVSAAATPRILRRLSIPACTVVALLLSGAPLVLVVVAPGAGWLTVLLLLWGVGDGIIAVLNNVTASLAAPPDARSAFIGLTGTIRNVGKLTAPGVGALASGFLSVGGTIAMIGGASLLALAAVPFIAAGLAGRPGGDSESPPGREGR
ncbi:MFS transporter [Lysobacter korlensis]|uniref:MFS transporter n=1 Tax=Lysobacter korlensis TaxID=553636 RepID=A0ABV6RUE6_9GAMM